MSSPEKTQAKTALESLVGVKTLKNFWSAHKGKFFDQLIAAKSGVWADCPDTCQVYFKTIYFDRNRNVTGQSYSIVHARRIILRLDRNLVRYIESYGSVSINSAMETAEVDSGTVLVNESDRSIVEIVPIKNVFSKNSGILSGTLYHRRYDAKDTCYVFANRQAGGQSEYLEDNFEEIFIELNLEDLQILKSDADKIDIRNEPEYKAYDDLISSPWMSDSLAALNKFYFKYKDELKNKPKFDIEAPLIKELSDWLSISNDQKLGDAYKIVSLEWSVFRRGILGDAKDGRIDILSAINRLAEVNSQAYNDKKGREEYTVGRSNKKMNDIFEARTIDNKSFALWIAAELPIDKKKPGSAIYKYITEFIKN